MAETWSRAFGRYLRTLRQRRELSLQDVCSLSQAFAEQLDKGYLSRCENGHQGPAFSKIIPLSRIYDVPADVLLERLELDMELDRVGSPPTEGLSYAELTDAATISMDQGFGWRAYAYLRDAIDRANDDEVRPSFRDRVEQLASAHMNCATGARRLGRHKFACFEYLAIERSAILGPRSSVILCERLSQSFRSMGQLRTASEYATIAIEKAESLGEPSVCALAYSNHAQVAFSNEDLDKSASLFQRAYDAYKKAGHAFGCARSLNNLAQVYFDQGRLRASRRAAMAAEATASRLQQHRLRALSYILLGEIESVERRQELARRRWREASAIAQRLDDKVLRFKAEFCLFRQARRSGNESIARSLERRLHKLANWIPEDTPELCDFNSLQIRA